MIKVHVGWRGVTRGKHVGKAGKWGFDLAKSNF